MAYLEKFKRRLSEPVDGQVIGLFRLVYGLFMAYNTWSYYRRGLISDGFLAPKILFKFDGFGWIQPLPEPVMHGIMLAMGLAALFIAAGIWFRQACRVFASSLFFMLFQEKSYFNNHIYFFILLAVLLSFTHADRFVSLRGGSRFFTQAPRWQQFILQAQVVIVYFYGGITKMKPDWLFRKEPVASMVNAFPADHWLAPVIKMDFMVDVLTYGGFLLDILAPWLLWNKTLRRWAPALFIVFHLTNSRIFNDIGIFPYMMLAALILFFESRELPFLRERAAGKTAKGKKRAEQPAVPATSAFTRNFLIVYFAFQLLFPFRGYFLPNPMDWTGIGKHFSWRMKVDARPVEEMKFTVQNPATGQVFPVEVNTFVNEMQIANMANDARSAAAFARMLREEAARQGIPGAVVKARIRVRYNGRPPQFFVDPDVDLASVTYSPFRKLDWVVPLEE